MVSTATVRIFLDSLRASSNMTIVEEFNQFGGTTIQEHKKQFFNYLNRLSDIAVPERIQILNALKAEHRQEEIFLAKLLLKFEQIDRIKHLILQGDRIINRVITNHKPFIFKDEDMNFFTNDLFPNVSYIVRNKCLIVLSKTITRDDMGAEFFNEILRMYGIKAAQIFLPVCAEAFVREVITHYRIVLKERQLITLHQRFGCDFLNFYYAECSKYGMSNQFEDQPFLSKYLATKDIATFCQLLKYGSPKVGKRGLKNFIQVKKEDILADPNKYADFIKPKILYRMLSREEYRMYFVKKLPKNMKHFNMYHFREDIKRVKKNYRGTFIAITFKEKYDCDIYSVKKEHNNIVETLKDLLSVEDILKFDLEEDDRLEYLPTSTAFHLIKERINLTSDINMRCELVMKLFRSAKNNNNEKALHEAIKFINFRHKNDTSSLRGDVFEFIRNNYKMQEFNDDIWKALQEMFQTEHMLSQYSYYLRDMLEEQLLYKYTKGLDFYADFRKLVKYQGCSYIYLPSQNDAFSKWILLHLPEVFKEIYAGDEEGQKRWPSTFLGIIHYWNKRHPKDLVSFFKYPEAIESALQHYTEYHNWDDLFPKGIVIFKTEDPEEMKLQSKLIEEHMSKFAQNVDMWKWLLKNRVDLVAKHINLFFEKCYSYYHIDWFLYELNKMHYTPLPEIARDFCTKRLQALVKKIDEKSDVSIGPYQMALLCLSYQKDYLEIINNEKFYPSGEAEVDVLNESFQIILTLRENVVESLRNRPCSKEVMPMLMRFCFKDYFRASLPVLTVVLYNLPERNLCEPLKILQDRSVTVRKRALFFATTLGTANMSCDALTFAGENEKNKSLQKFIFNRTIKNFRCVGNQEAWELLMNHFKFVFEKDTETHYMLLQFNLIPRTYLPLYFEKVWHSFGKVWENKHRDVLSAINADIMTLLSDELCDDIIHFNLVQSESLVSSDIEFIYHYLLSSGDRIDHRFQLVASNARVLADEHSKLGFKELNQRSRKISFLYEDLCRRLIERNGEEVTHLAEKRMLINKLSQEILNLPLPYNKLDYELHLKICGYYLDDPNKIPELLIMLQRETLRKHGGMILEYFNEFANSQIDSLLYPNGHKIDIVQKLLELDDSVEVKMLAIRLLPADYPSSETCALQFRNILDKIMEADSAPIVVLYLNRFLKNLSL